MATASYDQLAHQVQALRQENSHLRRELEDNSNHLFKLENETSDMKEVLKQLQTKLDQEAGTLASSGRSDVLDQLKELHMDLTNYYELKTRPAPPPDLLALAPPPSTLAPPPSALLRGPLRPPSSSSSRQNTVPDDALLDGAPPMAALIGGDGRMNEQHVEELYREKRLLLSEMEREERERCWFYSELQGLTQRLAQLPHIDTGPWCRAPGAGPLVQGPWCRPLVQGPWCRAPGAGPLVLAPGAGPGAGPFTRGLHPGAGPWCRALVQAPGAGPWSGPLVQGPGAGPWCRAPGAGPLVQGPWCRPLVQGPWCRAPGAGPWCGPLVQAPGAGP
ncbi:unnamed protein product [Boreogadus saida]